MRKLLLSSALAVSLAGCGVLFPSNEGEDANTVIEYAVQLCSFRPALESVQAILAAQNPLVTGAFNVALAICTAVSPSKSQGLLDVQPASPEDCPKVNGVCVEGEFVPEAEE